MKDKLSRRFIVGLIAGFVILALAVGRSVNERTRVGTVAWYATFALISLQGVVLWQYFRVKARREPWDSATIERRRRQLEETSAGQFSFAGAYLRTQENTRYAAAWEIFYLALTTVFVGLAVASGWR